MKNGVCRGAKPLCRESEGVPQIPISSPFLARKGVRGMFVPMAIGINTLIGMAWSTPSPFQLARMYVILCPL